VNQALKLFKYIYKQNSLNFHNLNIVIYNKLIDHKMNGPHIQNVIWSSSPRWYICFCSAHLTIMMTVIWKTMLYNPGAVEALSWRATLSFDFCWRLHFVR